VSKPTPGRGRIEPKRGERGEEEQKTGSVKSKKGTARTAALTLLEKRENRINVKGMPSSIQRANGERDWKGIGGTSKGPIGGKDELLVL